jgi:hypothetical protein
MTRKKKRKKRRACVRNRSADAKRMMRKRKDPGRAGKQSDDRMRTKMKTRKMRREKKFGLDDAARQERALGSERGRQCLFQPLV